MNFARDLEKLRLENNLSQEQFANKIGVSKQKVIQWELGQSQPKMQDYIAIGDAFHVNVDYLLNSRNDYALTRQTRQRRKAKSRKKPIIRLILLALLLLIVYVICSKIWLYFTNLNANKKESIENMVDYTEEQKIYVSQLSQMSEDVKKIDFIIDNINEYPTEILDLLIKNPETIDFISDYLNRQSYEGEIDISDDYEKGKIPLFLQWDKRWGYRQYGDNMIAINGCGPVCLSMVAVGLTGDTTLNPKVIADYSQKEGFYEDEAGTSWLLMSKGIKGFGLKSSEIILSEAAITKELKNGRPIIASVRAGDFTTIGHFIVLRGITSDGKLLIHDPNSIERSNKEWDLQVVMPQIRNLWSFSKAK
ncbi:C39 family peptidase [Proteiniborus sp. MB09-C3]|uniref:C39 family peptidase n=1 Tax=Proteiniborus sp. MB09-C3 TaxID=3050072 RepID=UPI0025521E3A|nr:C39 family peptidase [Proteiniborus sp. MB09-C3]WIV11834.1 papain-like cysteine protease family protein [Proteiniborus sp. MB09-C3]